MQIGNITNSIFDELCGDKEKWFRNPVFSPYSIMNAIALLRKSTCGKTADEIEKAMGEDFIEQIEDFSKSVSDNVLSSNVIFVESVPSLEYIKNISQINGECQQVNKITSEETKKLINKFISSHTNGLIPNFLTHPLRVGSSMFLANVLYFKDSWNKSFDKKHSKFDIFTDVNDRKQRILFMNGKFSTCEYEETEGYEMLKLKLVKNSFFTFIIPRGKITTSKIIEKCRTFTNDKYIVTAQIPVLEISYETYNIRNTLFDAGIHTLFEGSKTDWIPVTGIRNNINYFISDILHKVVIKVNEEGAEASAVTGCLQTNGCSRDDRQKIFECNKPFYYAITDMATSQILFLGMKATF